MDIESTRKPVLVCGNFRGLAQPIRYLLLYIGVPFQEIHLNKQGDVVEKEMASLVPKGIKLDPGEMPYLLHERICIKQVFPIMSYLCRRYYKEDLLGNNMYEKARIYEVMQRYVKNKSRKFMVMIKCMDLIRENPGNVKQYKKQACQCIISKSQYIEPMLKFYSLTQSYVLQHFTVLDILLYETSFYMENLFGDLREDFPQVTILSQFKSRFQKQQCYVHNRDLLNSYSILCPEYNKAINDTFRSLWLGDKSLFDVKCRWAECFR